MLCRTYTGESDSEKKFENLLLNNRVVNTSLMSPFLEDGVCVCVCACVRACVRACVCV